VVSGKLHNNSKHLGQVWVESDRMP
jgi:hypothetical protein